jgi:hypothetical protein
MCVCVYVFLYVKNVTRVSYISNLPGKLRKLCKKCKKRKKFEQMASPQFEPRRNIYFFSFYSFFLNFVNIQLTLVENYFKKIIIEKIMAKS